MDAPNTHDQNPIRPKSGQVRTHQSPTFDADGYPTDETLRTIREWPIKSNANIQNLLRYVQEAWRYKFVMHTYGSGREQWIDVATVGWSGNEELIGALRENRTFWALCWLESRRGGGYRFLTMPLDEVNAED